MTCWIVAATVARTPKNAGEVKRDIWLEYKENMKRDDDDGDDGDGRTRRDEPNSPRGVPASENSRPSQCVLGIFTESN